MSDKNEWRSWKAVCPKCEKFYTLKAYQPNFYCAHRKESTHNPSQSIAVTPNEPDMEKISCKIVPVKIQCPPQKEVR